MLVKIERNEFEEFFEDYNSLKSIVNFLIDNAEEEEEENEEHVKYVKVIDQIEKHLNYNYNISLNNYKDYFKEEFKENGLLLEYFEEYEKNVYYSRLAESFSFGYSRDWEKEIGIDKIFEIDNYVYGISDILNRFKIVFID